MTRKRNGEEIPGPGLTRAGLEWLAPYLSHVMAPSDYTVQEIAPGVFAHIWRWQNEPAERTASDDE